MFKALFGRNKSGSLAHALYGTVVARARDPLFYTDYGVPDTFDGRFELLTMHLFIVHNRLKHEDQESRRVSQLIFDAFIDDMDAALREAGVGDQTVPKRIAKMTQVFYGRTGAYEAALESREIVPALADVIARNMFPEEETMGKEQDLAIYMAWQVRDMNAKLASGLLAGRVLFDGPLKDVSTYAD
ncbi:MAG: ubiquinol-cytochrome C chaperone family protein [Rhizobiaceae bacterium]